MKDASIIILDEPTSSLDYRTEYEIVNLITHLSKTMTFIMSTHRLQSVTHADRIIMMSGGEISEIGTHKDLLKSNSEYSNLYKSLSI